MYARTEGLIQELHTRFGYTTDNMRDLNPEEDGAVYFEELAVTNAYNLLVEHLTACDPETDKACWGDYEPDDQAHHNH